MSNDSVGEDELQNDLDELLRDNDSCLLEGGDEPEEQKEELKLT